MLDLGLEGAHVLISGANGGIGRAISDLVTVEAYCEIGLPTVRLFLREHLTDHIRTPPG
jgi:hypothetical protein